MSTLTGGLSTPATIRVPIQKLSEPVNETPQYVLMTYAVPGGWNEWRTCTLEPVGTSDFELIFQIPANSGTIYYANALRLVAGKDPEVGTEETVWGALDGIPLALPEPGTLISVLIGALIVWAFMRGNR